MKQLLSLLVLFGAWQFSAPSYRPITCFTTCYWPVVTNGYTGIIVAQGALGQSIVVNGQTVTPDFVVPFNGDSIYHVAFTSLPAYPVSISVSQPFGANVFLFLYEGIYQYVKGAEGDYSRSNSVFPDCVNGQNCPYYWTDPVVASKGDLLIAFADSNSSGCGAFRPGPGWDVELVDCTFSIEDKVALVEAPDIGSMYASNLDGSDGGGSHWLMGIGVYARVH